MRLHRFSLPRSLSRANTHRDYPSRIELSIYYRFLAVVVIPLSLTVCILTSSFAQPLLPDVSDPWGNDAEDPSEMAPSDKTAEELTEEAESLLSDDGHLLEARTKLLNALRKNPSYYPAYVSLSYYYLAHVSHFRLAMKYIKAGERLFREQNGDPPYLNPVIESRHAQILYLLSQARLNLDDYSGSLAVLDEIQSRGYLTPSYAGSRAWVLMKLGRIDEAIREARIGLLMRAEPARTLNMLGILLSMNGQPEPAIEALKKASAIETSLGKQGQPATPVNNMGEVYEELFEDDKAEASWIKAKSYHDGCEHVLPSLNLALLYLEQLKVTEANNSISSFLSCVAQYSLRSDEEHRALVGLARGRFNLHLGKPGEALSRLSEAYEYIQWFGKIGTNQDDLEIGIVITQAQSWRALANRLSVHIASGVLESIRDRAAILRARLTSWWLYRKAARLLAERLRNIEDLTVRNTDSLIEYSTFGEVLSYVPLVPFERRLSDEQKRDKRPIAQVYYTAYLGENQLKNGESSRGIANLENALRRCRPKYDEGLKLHILTLLASQHSSSSARFIELVGAIFAISPSALRNAGLSLPVIFSGSDTDLGHALEEGGFELANGTNTPFSVEVTGSQDREISLVYTAKPGVSTRLTARGDSSITLVNNLNEAVFSVSLSSDRKNG